MTPRWTVLALITLLSLVTVAAQDTCEALVEQALQAVGVNCNALARNTACYGYEMVEAEFIEETTTDSFARPADTAPLSTVSGIRTAGYDAVQNQWGIAMLNVQANIPDTIPGQGVMMLLMGGAEVTDDGGTQPMQAFTFSSGVGASSCDNAPTVMAIESPQGIDIALTINGVDVVIGSTVLLTDGEDSFSIIVNEGQLTIAEDDTVITAGEALDLEVDEDRQATIWDEPRALTDDETTLSNRVESILSTVGITEVGETADAKRMYIVQPGDNLFRIALENGTCVSELARENSISATQLNTIPVGLELTIPDGSTCGAFVNDLPNPNTATQPSPDEVEAETITLDCTPLQPTSPTGGLPLTQVTFYWDGIPEATTYGITLYKDGQLVLNEFVPAPQTNLQTSLDNILVGLGEYYWTVTAFVGNEPVCSANSPRMLREWPEIRDPGGDNDGDNSPTCDVAALDANAMAACYAVGLYSWTLDTDKCTYTCF